MVCANHPFRQTVLRCNKCGKPICLKCAVHTPVGYRCKQCVEVQQEAFATARWYDYIVVTTVAAMLSALFGTSISFCGCFIFFLAPLIGIVLADLSAWTITKRHSRYLPWAGVIGVLLGGLALYTVLFLIILGQSLGWYLIKIGSLEIMDTEFGVLFHAGSIALYVLPCAGGLYYRLKRIRPG